MESLNDQFKEYPNYVYEKDISLLESLFNSDILITDWSGFMYEYAFGTERPVLFIDVPQKIVNTRYKEVGIEAIEIGLRKEIGEIINPMQLEKIDQTISKLINSRSGYKESIIKAREKYVYHFGESSHIGAEYILDYLNKNIR